MKASQRRGLEAAHAPAARKRAAATMRSQTLARHKLAKRFGEKPRAFASKHLLATIDRHEIPLSQVPAILFNGFPRLKRTELLAKRGANGHASGGGGIGIPLDAIPAKRKPGGGDGGGSGNYTRSKGHPNAPLIEKILDTLAKPDTSENVAERLLTALDKLIG